jgi:hypothetical protein
LEVKEETKESRLAAERPNAFVITEEGLGVEEPFAELGGTDVASPEEPEAGGPEESVFVVTAGSDPGPRGPEHPRQAGGGGRARPSLASALSEAAGERRARGRRWRASARRLRPPLPTAVRTGATALCAVAVSIALVSQLQDRAARRPSPAAEREPLAGPPVENSEIPAEPARDERRVERSLRRERRRLAALQRRERVSEQAASAKSEGGVAVEASPPVIAAAPASPVRPAERTENFGFEG